jgi:predicted RNA-binding protein YlxR (DUF448 family)
MDAVRTCVGCRLRASRSSLLRVVVRDSEVVIDDRAIMPGRGAWVHSSTKCLTLAIERKAFGRSLRVANLSTADLQNRLNGKWTTNERLEMSPVND